MTKKEIRYIQKRITQYYGWAKEEEKEARNSQDKQEREEHYLQYKLNCTAAEALDHILTELLEED